MSEITNEQKLAKLKERRAELSLSMRKMLASFEAYLRLKPLSERQQKVLDTVYAATIASDEWDVPAREYADWEKELLNKEK